LGARALTLPRMSLHTAGRIRLFSREGLLLEDGQEVPCDFVVGGQGWAGLRAVKYQCLCSEVRIVLYTISCGGLSGLGGAEGGEVPFCTSLLCSLCTEVRIGSILAQSILVHLAHPNDWTRHMPLALSQVLCTGFSPSYHFMDSRCAALA